MGVRHNNERVARYAESVGYERHEGVACHHLRMIFRIPVNVANPKYWQLRPRAGAHSLTIGSDNVWVSGCAPDAGTVY